MESSKIEKRAWRLFESRFLPQAEDQSQQDQLEDKLSQKMARVEDSSQASSKLGQVARQASQLWQRRSELSKKDLLYLAGALLYFISPIDAIPDVLPGIGYVDDVIVLSAVVGVILRAVSTAGRRATEEVDQWIDARAERLTARIDESADHGIQKTIVAVAIGLWGATTAAAISLSLAVAVGGFPVEWITYVSVSTAVILACNAMTAAYFWKEFRGLSGQWQTRLLQLVSSKVTAGQVVALVLPILVLFGLGLGRVWLG